MVVAVEEVGVLEGGVALDEGTREVGHLQRTEAGLQRSVLQGFLYHLLPLAVLLSSAWTRLSTAILLASNRLWPSSAAAKGMQPHQVVTQDPSLGLLKPLKVPPLDPQPDMIPRGPTTTLIQTPTSRSQGRW